jgi:hypothetical protein
MKVPSTPLSRRTMLRGAGALIALPWLEAMAPRRARAESSTTPRRVLYYFIPNGAYMPSFTPSTSGSGFSLSPQLAPLAGLEHKISVLTNLDNHPGRGQTVGDAHFRGTGSFLTAQEITATVVANVGGPSVDQVAALSAGVGDRTAFRSLQLGTEPGGTGAASFGFSFAYVSNISWRDATTPLAKEGSPARVFERLFSGYGTSVAISPAEAEARRRRKLSVLDFVADDATALRQRLGAHDRQKMDQYLTAVRDLEQRIQATPSELTCTVPSPPIDLPYPDRIDQMIDVMILAFQCDLTRIITFMQKNAGAGDPNYDWVTYESPVPGQGPLRVDFGKHNVSHQLGDNPSDPRASHWPLMYEAIGRWEFERFRRLLDGLDAIDEGDGTALDHALIICANEYSTGWDHNHENIPVVVAGAAPGLVTPGQHVVFPRGTPLSNLHLTALHSLGLSTPSFGDSTGPLRF